MKKFKEYKGLDLSEINKSVLARWQTEKTFEQSLKVRSGAPAFVFYEGPPSANGMPGIHHIIARTIKDIFCRYKTQKGFLVNRKAGWDTHGLPVELGVEKALGITKEDIGKSISVEEYNNVCRKDVLKFTNEWEDITAKMGYWVDMQNPYITYDNRYIETLWYLLKELYKKGLLYKGYTIQPYSPAAGTGLSTHELNQPGCYRDVKDTTCTAMFKVLDEDKTLKAFNYSGDKNADIYVLAWTTTPWTLPSNTALCVGPNIDYVLVESFNPYNAQRAIFILAKALLNAHFNPQGAELPMTEYKAGEKVLPYRVLGECKGSALENIPYQQLFPCVKVEGEPFRVIMGDYVSTEDGTGIVHIAPTFGADDARVAKAANIPPLHLKDKNGNPQPMVDKQGRFFPLEDLEEAFVKNFIDEQLYSQYAGRFVKNAYDASLDEKAPTLDVDLCVELKQQGLVFKIEKHTHNYPHCWRTDKPVLYYPLDSWFIRTTACREDMIELNKTIQWKPESTGIGRFGKWLENLQDWNLSRSRYWGTPLPIWRTEDGKEEICIGSMEELVNEIDKAVQAGLMKENPYQNFTVGDYSQDNYAKIDLHRPYVDNIILVSPSGKPMKRETDLIDVWFDSGAMPYAQAHYPFENKELVENGSIFPADFIAEGIDQTRGWFFTLHAISTMLRKQVAFKAVIANGLVLDKDGNKMSKRLGNSVDPFAVIDKHGSDPLRWYMITNASPWDNLKFNIAGVEEVTRKFFGTLYNTYSFFALYANVDGFVPGENAFVPVEKRPEIDRWIISLLNTLVKNVDECFNDYEPTRAGRLIQDFVTENLSNWYVRLNRKRFWGGGLSEDKLAAYQTLYTCLETVARLAAPIAPFYMEQLYRDLSQAEQSVHLSDFPKHDEQLIDPALEERMNLAQQISSMVLALRRKVNIRVRQPLSRIMIPILSPELQAQIENVQTLIKNEVNVKEIEFISDATGIISKKIKPNFKTLGPKYSKLMKAIAALVAGFSQEDIARLEKDGFYAAEVQGEPVKLLLEDVEISSEDIPGWLVATEGRLTIALDITLSDELRKEGTARELINRIQNLRKDSGFEVTDKISIRLQSHPETDAAIAAHRDYIASQVLAEEIEILPALESATQIDMDEYQIAVCITRK